MGNIFSSWQGLSREIDMALKKRDNFRPKKGPAGKFLNFHWLLLFLKYLSICLSCAKHGWLNDVHGVYLINVSWLTTGRNVREIFSVTRAFMPSRFFKKQLFFSWIFIVFLWAMTSIFLLQGYPLSFAQSPPPLLGSPRLGCSVHRFPNGGSIEEP